MVELFFIAMFTTSFTSIEAAIVVVFYLDVGLDKLVIARIGETDVFDTFTSFEPLLLVEGLDVEDVIVYFRVV